MATADQQPEALRLAALCDAAGLLDSECDEIAAELRRLHTELSRLQAGGQGEHEPNAKLMELADRIDHEQLWGLSGIAQMDLPPEKRDRLDAGVHLRRYADLLGNGNWRIYPPRPGTSFRAGSLDAVVAMARRDEARRSPSDRPPASPALVPLDDSQLTDGYIQRSAPVTSDAFRAFVLGARYAEDKHGIGLTVGGDGGEG